MVSHALLSRVERVRTIGEGQLASIDDDPNSRRDAGDSDHAPVVVQLND
jgi:exonuclease III